MTQQFEITRARQKLGFTPSTAVSTNIQVPNTDTGAAIGQAIIGGAKIVDNYTTKVANAELSEYKRKADLDDVELKAEIRAELDPNKHPDIYKRHEEARKTFRPSSSKGKRAAELWNNTQEGRYAQSLSDDMKKTADDNWLTEYSAQVAGIAQGNGKLADTEAYIARRQLGGDPLKSSTAANLLTGARLMASKGAVNSIKPTIEAVLAENDYKMKPVNETIDAAVGQLQKDGILGEVGAAEARKDLSNWAADVAAQRKRSINNNVIQTYSGLADELAEGAFTGDSIILSGLPQARIKEDNWAGIREGARKPAPTKNTVAGTNKATDTLYDYSIGKIGEKEALKNLMHARYVDKNSITHDLYAKSLNRIKNKYPDDVAKTMQGVMDEAKNVLKQQGVGLFFGKDFIDPSEKDELAEVKVGLFNWVEAESVDGKYPTGEEMYKKVRELGIAVKTPASVIPPPEKIVPVKTDRAYVVTDDDFDKIESGEEWYDEATGEWYRKK